MSEKGLYQPTRAFLHSTFLKYFGNCHLEITAFGKFEEDLKKAIRHDIVFSFLKRGFSPDLAGFIEGEYGAEHFITVEIKSKEITIRDIGQAKVYGDLFDAKYAFLISPQPITVEIMRLQQELSILNRFKSGYNTYIGQLRFSRTTVMQGIPINRSGVSIGVPSVKVLRNPNPEVVQGVDWFPESPFPLPEGVVLGREVKERERGLGKSR